ncbi:MAG: DbpA RNA binding domain-containing protein [Paramuribaculum sp.]|nr:DbpA RNA binding domain-containing protein [Paramuribaculum sp.]
MYTHLRKNGLPAGLYHGGLDQQKREQAIDLLNNGTTPILVSTDLGARGLDIDKVEAVVHYHMPPSAESMTHRNGRTARMGASGTVYYITSEGEDIPEYVEWDREYVPTGQSADPIRSHVATLYFNAGKKEKISRGDVAGFLIANAALAPDEVGKIVIKDHSALAAVPAEKASDVLQAANTARLKGKKVRVTLLK